MPTCRARDLSGVLTGAASILDHAAILINDYLDSSGSMSAYMCRAMRRDLPYALMPVPGHQGVSILVNRGCKPAGRPNYREYPPADRPHGLDWVNYEDHPAHWMAISEAQMESLPWPRTRGYLFNDGCAPWLSRHHARAYLERLDAINLVVRQRG